MTLASQIASGLLNTQTVYLKSNDPFTWAFGTKSPIYTDNHVTLSYPKTRTLTENDFVEKIKEESSEVEMIAGTVIARIPHGVIIADKVNLPFAYIRSKPKDHGAGDQIRGRVTKGQKVAVIEDLISTGGSVLEAVTAVGREGVDIVGIMTIFIYELPKAIRNFEKAGVKLVTLSNYTELIEAAKVQGYITADDPQLLHEFKENQEAWRD